MDPVRPGDTGPGVEDIQRRLRILGYDIGRTGIDGVFLGQTTDAVRSFQSSEGLAEDGWVGDQTWAALVDATFTLGDRMLYLRLPHFHGHDVRALQNALNVLGFACGETDGIFGSFSERAVREFQRNAGLPADGIVGPETVRSLLALRHVWEGKHPAAHSAAKIAPARAAEVLARTHFTTGGLDEAGSRIAGRVVNLALATTDEARVSIIGAAASAPSDSRLLLRIATTGTGSAVPGRPLVRLEDGDMFISRLITAVESVPKQCPEVIVEVAEGLVTNERDEQRVAVRLLDAVCSVFD